MPEINCWITDSLHRIYKDNKPSGDTHHQLNVARNDLGSFQVGLRKNSKGIAKAKIKVEKPDEIILKIRKVGYVPVPHNNTNTDIGERQICLLPVLRQL